MDLHDGFRITQALLWYWHNASRDDIITAVYGTTVTLSYRYEKLGVMQRGLDEFWGHLDVVHQYRLLKTAWERYGKQASEQRLRALKDPEMFAQVMEMLKEPHAT